MTKNYVLGFVLIFVFKSFSQTTVTYTQQTENYNTIFTNGTAGVFNDGTTQMGMYANTTTTKQVVAWKNFTEDGTTTGTPTTMNIGDSFKISLAAYQAYGQIGIALLSSPTATSSWSDRINRYAVQVNLPGNSGSFDPWEIISKDGMADASSINGSIDGLPNEFEIIFELFASNSMEITIKKNFPVSATYSKTVTLNNVDITGYSIYLDDDYDGDSNENIYWKPSTEYTYANVWNGSTDSNWDEVLNWSTNNVPSGSSNVRIPKQTNQPTASFSATVSRVYLESGASLIAQSSFLGTVIYERSLGTTNWYLIAAPVDGQDIDTFVSNEGLAAGSNSNLGFAPYVNDGTAWDYYQNGASGTGNFVAGKGYSVKLAAAGDVSFTGTMPVSDVGIPISSNTNGYNLIGNPYPSYIAANDPADGTNNLLKVNDTDNDFLTESTIWLWNELTDTYDIINHASAFYIAPAQGFFVSSNGSHTFSITEAMQSHQTGDSFQRITSDRPEIQLILTDGSATRDTDIFYINGTTTGFDNGYDSSIFGGAANSFAVYTHVVANGQGRDLGIQSLPNSDFENMIIPVGVNAISGSTLSFTANIQNLPQGIHVYLEDALTNTFTQLNSAGGEYNITINNDMSGIGRFYLRTTSQALGFDNVIMMDHVSIYSNEDNSILNIAGLDDGKTRLNLFDLTGKLIMETAFNSNRFNTVSFPELNSGIYIVKLESENGILNKKILID